MVEVHTIPVPEGWSVEQAWTTIDREGQLPAHTQGRPIRWASVVVVDGKLSKLVD